MLYLITGANGTGKTLLSLKHVKEMADKETRPVCYNGRFDLVPDGPLKNWRKIDIKDWQAEPDGTIFFVDECHNDFPLRSNGATVPEYVRMLAEHRKRGFDFFLITQHPQNIDVFVRRLIGNPGWHRHLKRVAGAQVVSQLQWDAVNPNCERPGSGESGQVTTVLYPKEVYNWYVSAQLHTAKVKIPRAVWVLGIVCILVPVAAYITYASLKKNFQPKPPPPQVVAATAGQKPAQQPGPVVSGDKLPLTPAEYVQSRMPRIPGLAYTAPAYDEVTRASVAPFPAACVKVPKKGECTCYTQQATRLDVPKELCIQIAEHGFFVDWQQAQPQQQSQQRTTTQAPAVPAAQPAAKPIGTGAMPAERQEDRLLSSPGSNVPVFFPALRDDGPLAGLAPTASEANDAAIMRTMRQSR